ncbi:conjugal transfer protein TraL (plasmid) [Geobacter anodireducens]|nr:conjugal transfer protein TraL [Geobacter anodireducens]
MRFRFPTYLTQPYQILWFEIDDLMFFLMSIIVAQAIGGWSWLGVILVPWGCTKLKRNYPRGFGKHVLYYLGLIKMSNYPDYFIKEFVE